MTNNQDLSRVAADSARGGFFLFSGAALSTLIMAISTILIGRLLGPKLYGQYSLIMVVPSLLFLFTDLGVEAGITKYAASLRLRGDYEQIGNIISNGLLFRLGVGAVLTVACIAFSGYFALLVNRPDLSFWIQTVAIVVTLQVVFTTANATFIGIDRSELNALVSNVQALVRTGSQIVLVLAGFGLGGALIGYVGGYVVSGALGGSLIYRYLRQKGRGRLFSRDGKYREILGLLSRYGMPVYVAVVLTGFFSLYQQMVLSFFVSDAAIGNFRAAFNFIMLLAIVPSSLGTALLPAFSKLESASSENLNLFARLANKYINMILVPATILVILYAEPIVNLIYGSGYSSAVQFLQVNALIYFFAIFGYQWLNNLFNGVGKTGLTMRVTLVNFIILLCLSPILAALYGVMGVVVVYVVGALVSSIYSLYVAKQQLKVELEHKATFRILITAWISVGPSVGLLLILPTLNSLIMLASGVAVYLLTYITLMPLLGILNAAELETLCQVTDALPLGNQLTKMLRAYQMHILLIFKKT